MYVAASTECFPDLPLADVIERLIDLEYTSVELDIHENGGHLKPSQIAADPDTAFAVCRQLRRLTPVAMSVDIDAEEDEYYRQFHAVCKLANSVKVVALTVPSSELGTPFNAEVERLRKLVTIATTEGVLVGVKTETGRISEDPDTTLVLCNNVNGLGITLDPSHFIFGPSKDDDYEKLMPLVYHVHLRDTTKESLQVRVGQGNVEYGRLVAQLNKVKYRRALSVHITPTEDVDHFGELRKLRLLLESLL